MNSNYKVLKFKSNNSKEINDQVSIEEPLEIIIKYKDKDNLSLNNNELVMSWLCRNTSSSVKTVYPYSVYDKFTSVDQ